VSRLLRGRRFSLPRAGVFLGRVVQILIDTGVLPAGYSPRLRKAPTGHHCPYERLTPWEGFGPQDLDFE
jgi:hypothetical protein